MAASRDLRVNIIVARTEWSMSAKYLFTELPEWELDVLLDEWNHEQDQPKGDG